MNYKEIEDLKLALTSLAKQGCRLTVPAYEVDGKVVGIGFKPYWTNPGDSKIDRLEFNIVDMNGRIAPFNFNYITGYDVVSKEGNRIDNLASVRLDISVFSPDRGRKEEPTEKIRVEISRL